MSFWNIGVALTNWCDRRTDRTKTMSPPVGRPLNYLCYVITTKLWQSCLCYIPHHTCTVGLKRKEERKIVRDCCTKHAAVGSKSKGWLARNQHIVSQERYVYPWTISVKNLTKFVWISTKRTLSYWNVTCFCHDIAENFNVLISSQPVFALTAYCCMLSGHAANTNFIVLISTKRTLSYWNVTCFCHDIAENFSFGFKQQSLTILLSSFLFYPPPHLSLPCV
jgi:hypothetical protein